MASKAEIAKIVAVLGTAFPSFRAGKSGAEVAEYTRQMIKTYHLVLGELDAGQLMQTALELAKHNTFFPSTGELWQAYHKRQALMAGEPTAQEAWHEVRRLFRKGYSRLKAPTPEDVSHPRIWKALEGIGGWLALCNSENDVADRARFLQAYEVYEQRDEAIGRMSPEVRARIAEVSEARRLPSGNGGNGEQPREARRSSEHAGRVLPAGDGP